MYQPKVTTTQKHSDSQGDHIVCKGKLVLIEATKFKVLDSNPIQIEDRWINPIIISETEEIEVGDKVLYANSIYDVLRIDQHNRPIVKFEDGESQLAIWNKVLALPENFSEKHLQAIIDGKLNNGDEVLIKIQEYGKVIDEDLIYFGHTLKVDSVYIEQGNIPEFGRSLRLSLKGTEFEKTKGYKDTVLWEHNLEILNFIYLDIKNHITLFPIQQYLEELNYGKMNDRIEISREEYEQLKEDQKLLKALQGAGVDNWEGYDVAIEYLED